MINIDPKANENKTQQAIAAELDQEIDQAEDRLNQLASESDAVESRINELRMVKIQTMTEFYNIQREMLTDDIAYQEYAMSLYDETTEGYRKHAQEKLDLIKEQQKYNKQELEFLLKERDTNKSLTNAQINELNELIRAKKNAIWDMAKMIDEMNTLIINSKLDKQMNRMSSESKKYADAISDIQDKIKYDLDDDKDMGKHIDFLKQIVALRKGEQADIENNIKYLKEQLKANRDNKEVVEKITSELESQEEQLKDTKNAIKDTNIEIKEVYEKLADDYVELYKEQLELMQQADEKYYADKIEAEQKAHEKRMKQLDKEMEALEEAYAKQMKMIDRAESARTHENDVSKLQKEADELKKQIDLLSMDDSYEAKAKKAELVKQLTEKELQLSETEHNREVELRKDNLEDDLDAEKEKLENRREKYEEDTDNYIKSLEEQAKKKQEYWEAELINEKKFAEMRKQVLEGNFAEMEATIKTWSENVAGEMGNLGQQVTDNFTKKVNEAIDSIKQLNSMKIKSVTHSQNNSGTKNKDGELKEPSTPPKDNELNDDDVIDEMKRNSWRWKNAGSKAEKDIYYKANQKLGADIGATYKNGSWYKNGKKLYELRSGGYTGDWSGDGGRLAVLHKKELVLNEDQTRNILDTARIVERMKSFVPNLLNVSTPKTSEPVVSSAGSSEHNEYNIEVNINGNADKKVADTVADQIINKIKRTKGGRF
ncbi:hypothetical protein FPZ44_24395 [Paenibacillus agilis]|uniref:Phage tail tape measure protein n=2 Tax=Paenibacillus agilis TaxID=3020863 RepID=A0A559IF73_9BACL|nr:hypothetical protein FPZ44_24395 [Paenibacillus agilis]